MKTIASLSGHRSPKVVSGFQTMVRRLLKTFMNEGEATTGASTAVPEERNACVYLLSKRVHAKREERAPQAAPVCYTGYVRKGRRMDPNSTHTHHFSTKPGFVGQRMCNNLHDEEREAKERPKRGTKSET